MSGCYSYKINFVVITHVQTRLVVKLCIKSPKYFLKYINQIIYIIGMNYCYRFIIFMHIRFYFKEDGESKFAAETNPNETKPNETETKF